ncbi:PREDICTED: uncharacterized protein LOC106103316 [Papilio polytes]|uniref:uncharacterized protein LOC106103316 n=1 Tax=Papilio polytes TaxID=76194 RepID=UPI0006762D26|nr:PREDICTED: uncharacterized protein LOC106103316 [Papilio polytes]
MAAWLWFAALVCGSQAAVLPPPWADAKRNPCATHPRGWLMLYWPADGKCYTIYKKGYPCSETQELSPGRWGGRTVAECKCPPGTAQLPHSDVCHKLFERGPCRPGEYFAPVEETFNKRGVRQGMCVRPQQCADSTLLYWPADGRCYHRLTQGPCYPGTILDLGTDGLANCTCESDGQNFWSDDGGCYAHYTRGPLKYVIEISDYVPLFHSDVIFKLSEPLSASNRTGPKYNKSTFEFNSRVFQVASCSSRKGAVTYDNACHWLHTQGPCAADSWLVWRDGRAHCECRPDNTCDIQLVDS